MFYPSSILNEMPNDNSRYSLVNKLKSLVLILPLKKITNVPACESPRHGADKSHAAEQAVSSAEDAIFDEPAVQELFDVVNELKQDLTVLLHPQGRQLVKININGQQVSLLANTIALPGGEKIAAGYFMGRLVVYHKESYYIDQLVTLTPRWTSLLLQGLLGQLSQVTALVATVMLDNACLSANPMSPPNQLAAPQLNVPDKWQHWLSLPFGLLADVMTFPLVSAESLPNSTPRPLVENTAVPEIEIDGMMDLFELFEEADMQIEQGHSQRDSEDVLPSGTPPLVFSFDQQKYAIKVANRAAVARLNQLHAEYRASYDIPPSPVYGLLDFDQFLGKKISEVFDRGLMLKQRIKSLDLILFKLQTEKMILQSNESDVTRHTNKKIINTYQLKQIKLSSFIGEVNSQITNAAEKIDFESIAEVIKIKNGMSYQQAKVHIQNRYDKETNSSLKNDYIDYYRLLIIMERSAKKYLLELHFETHSTTLERLLYLNERNIFNALIEKDNEKLFYYCLEYFCYQIFEYNRENEVSIQTNYLIMPGELSKYRQILEEDNVILHQSQIIPELTEELYQYINSGQMESPHLKRVMTLKEYLHHHDHNIYSVIGWRSINQYPYAQLKKILEENIMLNLQERIKIISAEHWQVDFGRQLQQDRLSYILTELLLNIQVKVNQAINNLHFLDKRIQAKTPEQRIALSKIYAVKELISDSINFVRGNDYLIYYHNQIHEGNFNYFIYAALYWYISEAELPVEKLRQLDAVELFRKFSDAEQSLAYKINSRIKENYSSVYHLKPSSKMNDLQEYYDQFIEYKIHDMYHEACNMTINVIDNSELKYYDALFPAKKSYVFKAYSRKYLHNTLMPTVWVSTPANNIGYVCILLTDTDELILMSTLSNVSVIKNITHMRNHPFITRLMEAWDASPEYLLLRSRVRLAITTQDIDALFSIDTESSQHESIRELILLPPEQDQLVNPTPKYSFLPVKEISSAESVISYIDNLYIATLTEITDILKEQLRDYDWVDYITSQIPFYHLLQRHWYDEEHEIAFKDVIFDIFDLIQSLFPTGLHINKIIHATLSNIIKEITIKNIPKHLIRRYIMTELLRELPGLGLKSSMLVSSEFMKFVNPVPIPEILFSSFTGRFSEILKKSINVINNSILHKNDIKNTMRNNWAIAHNKNHLTKNADGLYKEHFAGGEIRSYIKNQNTFYQIQWDRVKKSLCIINPHEGNSLNNAIPIKKGKNGEWVLNQSISKIQEYNQLEIKNFPHERHFSIDHLQFESMPPIPSARQQPSLASTLYHHKLLRLFVAENQAIVADSSAHAQSIESISSYLFDILTNKISLQSGPTTRHLISGKYSLMPGLKNLIRNQDMKTKLRSILMWSNEHDHAPVHQIVFLVEIDDNSFIIDFKPLRKIPELRELNDQVYFSDEWLMFYRNVATKFFQLIKFKDVDNLAAAIDFHEQQKKFSGLYSKDTFLLKEPVWYKKKICQRKVIASGINLPLQRFGPFSLRDVARGLFRQCRENEPVESFAVKVLRAAELIAENDANNVIALLKKAMVSVVPVVQFMHATTSITSFDDLLKISEGKLLCFLGEQGVLKHVLISLGLGRFASSGNNFFNASYANRPSIMVAEELGLFENEVFKPRDWDGSFSLIAGNAINSRELMFHPAQRQSTKHMKVENIDGSMTEKHVGPKSREEMLLGPDWSMETMHSPKIHIRIRAHGAPFNINHMDALELAHAIRGLLLADSRKIDFNAVEYIELYSCFSGYGGQYSTAQIVANELNIAVKSFPDKISPAIKNRRAEWFTRYQPLTTASKDNNHVLSYAKANAKRERLAKKHVQLHDLMQFIRQLRISIVAKRHKRAILPTMSIHMSLARLILADISLTDFLRIHPLCEDSQQQLFALLAEYNIQKEDPHEFYIQCFMDITSSVPDLQYLLRQWRLS